MQFLKSLDDILYEVMTWLVFYPVTLWRTLRHPSSMMDYADTELDDSEEQQYSDTLSPPLFLLLTLLLSHLLELAIVGQSTLVASRRGLAVLVTDDTTLLVMRLLIFSLAPLILAVLMVRQRREVLTRDTLREPFYSQCYLAGPFALMFGIGSLAFSVHSGRGALTGFGLTALALLWYGWLQGQWFARKLGVSVLRGFGVGAMGIAAWLLAVGLIGVLTR